jgi:hypothetical protein
MSLLWIFCCRLQRSIKVSLSKLQNSWTQAEVYQHSLSVIGFWHKRMFQNCPLFITRATATHLPHCKATWQRVGPGSHGIVRLTIWTGTVCDTTTTRRRSRLDICSLHVVTIVIIIMDEEGWWLERQPLPGGWVICRLASPLPLPADAGVVEREAGICCKFSGVLQTQENNFVRFHCLL